jgi:ankyrin repeat protein
VTFDQAHRAIKRGQLTLLKEAIPHSLRADETNRFGWTLLMLAAIEGNIRIGALLIERGADVSALNHFGESALSLAAHKGHLPFVKLLKSNGAPTDPYPHGHSLEEWLRISSGLPETKVRTIMDVILQT